VFRTRPPRDHAEARPARLACIRHAASVDPEPGSNSPPRPQPPSISRRGQGASVRCCCSRFVPSGIDPRSRCGACRAVRQPPRPGIAPQTAGQPPRSSVFRAPRNPPPRCVPASRRSPARPLVKVPSIPARTAAARNAPRLRRAPLPGIVTALRESLRRRKPATRIEYQILAGRVNLLARRISRLPCRDPPGARQRRRPADDTPSAARRQGDVRRHFSLVASVRARLPTRVGVLAAAVSGPAPRLPPAAVIVTIWSMPS
jgi:hypothetical protein